MSGAMSNLLQWLRAQGIRVELKNGRLRLTPWMLLSHSVRKEVKKAWKILTEEVAREDDRTRG